MDPARMSKEELTAYSGNAARISSAIEHLTKSDGWRIFLELFAKREQEIKDKRDYVSIEAFQSDRTALDIFHSIIDDFEGYVQDAANAASLLAAMADEPEKERGILVIEEQGKGGTIEG